MIPYTCFGNEELKNQPETEDGMEIICPNCGQLHKIRYATDEAGKKSSMLSFYKCPTTGETYLAGVGGKMIIGTKK